MKKSNQKDNTFSIIIIILLICILYRLFNKNEKQTKQIVVLPSQHTPLFPKRRINIPTRGEPPSYKSIGFLVNKNKNTHDDNILSLYGRPTYRGSSNWNYYTIYDGIRIPVGQCGNTKGCREKFNGETIRVNALHDDFTIRMYKDNGPRYIPY